MITISGRILKFFLQYVDSVERAGIILSTLPTSELESLDMAIRAELAYWEEAKL